MVTRRRKSEQGTWTNTRIYIGQTGDLSELNASWSSRLIYPSVPPSVASTGTPVVHSG